jgi:hypothetical protein
VLFPTVQFLVFFCVVFGAHWCLVRRPRSTDIPAAGELVLPPLGPALPAADRQRRSWLAGYLLDRLPRRRRRGGR